ncbi:toxin ParE [Candidatus Termititenax aidoneus]|uniref:Toxin ParE n=1 Tax=Termititenax aidoneus TaxID=2218524 RepID=A0A388T767_TERA1|nr:toxin ParE [Candidatus Termititenax aidoneus]
MPQAAEDLDSIFAYISNNLHNPQAAGQLMADIEAAFMTLKNIPYAYPSCSNEYLQKKNYRKLIVKNYMAFYIIQEETKLTLVMRVLYSRRDYEQLL